MNIIVLSIHPIIMIIKLDFEAEALVTDFEGLRVSFGKITIN